ncbi:MAG: mechanosensitive ion channel [Flavobacteriaceae bacterium]|nr:mechanosensitive ion channel [Flavobacteriaceae bacterium]
MEHIVYDYLLEAGLTETLAKYLNMIALLIALLVVVFLVDFVIRKLLVTAFTRLASKTKSIADDILVKNKVPRNVAHIVPLIIAIKFIPVVLYDFSYLENIVEKGLQLFGIVLTLWIVRSILQTLRDFFKTIPGLKDKPIDSYIQVFMIFAWVAGFMFAFALISGVPLLTFLAALGTASAVFILVFRDTILGFVASIQVSINDMVRIGDWITFEKYGADGTVTEINLSTVKVQNFDKTITTIPTYALISDSFKNWRGMEEADGRRIKRALKIKLDSVKYLNDNDIDGLKKIDLISAYLTQKQSDINDFNAAHNIDKSLPINGRNLTNLGVFRKYMQTYIEGHSAINKDMIIMVRQLEPTAQGVPLQIYAFSSDKRWQNYEFIMADIFDHMIAAVAYFDLEIFEFPSDGIQIVNE